MAVRASPVELADRLGLRLASELVPGRAPIASGLVVPPPVHPVTADVAPLLPEGGLAGQIAIPAGRLGATGLLWRLLAGASSAGRWCAVVGLKGLHPLAAASAGVNLERLVLVDAPGPDTVVALGALVEGIPVIVASTQGLTARQAQRAAARARRSGSALIWWEASTVSGVDARLEPVACDWIGLRANTGRRYGAGRLRGCRLSVTAAWRGRGHVRGEVCPYGPDQAVAEVVPFSRSARSKIGLSTSSGGEGLWRQ